MKWFLRNSGGKVAYELVLTADKTTISASGGNATLSTTLIKYLNKKVNAETNVNATIKIKSNRGDSFTLTNNVISAPNRDTTVGNARNIILEAEYKIGKKTIVSNEITITQEANNKIPGAIAFNLTNYSNIDAAGGTASPQYTQAYQNFSFTSGSSLQEPINIIEFAWSISGYGAVNVSNGEVKFDNNKSTSSRTANITASIYRNRVSASFTAKCTQNAGSKVYSSPVFQDYHYDTRSAAGGTLTPYISATQNWTWNGVANSGETFSYTSQTPIEGPTFTFSVRTDCTGMSLNTSNGIVTWSANTGNERSGAININCSWNGMTNNSYSTVTQNADSISHYSDITINSFSVDDIPASGGTISSGTYTASQTVYYVSGRTSSITSGFHASYSSAVSASSKGTVESSRSSIGNLTLTLSLNGKTRSKSVTVYQEANTYYDHHISLSLSTLNVPAGGGTVDCTINCYRLYASGSYSDPINTGGSITVSSPASVSGLRITVPSRGTTAGDARTFTVNASYNGLTTSGSFSQAANTYSDSGGVRTYGTLSKGTTTNPTIPASGGNATATASNGSILYEQSAVIRTYASGSTQTISAASSGSESVSPSVASIQAYAASKGTTISGVTPVKSQTVTWDAHGKSVSGRMNIYQQANTVTYGDVVIDLYSKTYDIPASGGNFSSSDWSGYQKITYTSGSYIEYKNRSDFGVRDKTNNISASNLGTTEKERTFLGRKEWYFDGKGGKTTIAGTDVYQAANTSTTTYTAYSVKTTLQTSYNFTAASSTYDHEIHWERTKNVNWTSGSRTSTNEVDHLKNATSSDPSWLDISIMDVNSVVIDVSANTGSARTGTIEFVSNSGQTYTVTINQAKAEVVRIEIRMYVKPMALETSYAQIEHNNGDREVTITGESMESDYIFDIITLYPEEICYQIDINIWNITDEVQSTRWYLQQNTPTAPIIETIDMDIPINGIETLSFYPSIKYSDGPQIYTIFYNNI